MPFVSAEGRADEQLDEGKRLLVSVLARAYRDDVRVIVLPPEPRGLKVPREGRPHSPDFVRRYLLAVSRASDDDPQAPGVGRHGLAAGDAHGRVIVHRII